ncbi:SAM-dependent methyltransferase [Marinobacterium aestuarii]|uniref:SAM-dependent methyltransferase n=1 Tax=Marinobacterium aestuarii TaxID=1821621 RepID=A0A1A9EZX2_9GAMM|nr:class I SAM-dependent methyltransferase [Marinobacterium aestuarii]ANG63455.1 SAM-dependent methyltransferase [Marinobacterium aestuarii]
MAQNIYDRSEFFDGYSQLPRSVHGLDGAPEWAAIRAMLPGLDGKRVVDLGCGFGWFARWAREQGAVHVLGLDLSEKMLERAKSATNDENIDYKISDLEQLALPEGAFDFAYSSLAFHYIDDFGKLVATIYRALTPGARFVFTIEHPIYMAPVMPAWSRDGDGRRIWPLESYSVEGPRKTDWFAKGVIKHHRTIGTTLNTLINLGFSIRHVQEWAPTGEQVTENPGLLEELDRPMMLLISVQK